MSIELGANSRLVRWYGISSTTETHVRITWQEKFVKNPSNLWHFKYRADLWKRRVRKLTRADFDANYRQNPPQTTMKKQEAKP